MKRLTTLMDFIRSGVEPRMSKKALFFMSKITEEAMSELAEAPPDIVEDQFNRMAAAMYWVATGNVIQNMDMPIGFWDYAGQIPNQIESNQRLAIEGSKPVE